MQPGGVAAKHTGLWSRLKAPEPVTLVRIQAGLLLTNGGHFSPLIDACSGILALSFGSRFFYLRLHHLVFRKHKVVPALLQDCVRDAKAPRWEDEHRNGTVLKMPIDQKFEIFRFMLADFFLSAGRPGRLPTLSRMCSEFDSCSSIIRSRSRATFSEVIPSNPR